MQPNAQSSIPPEGVTTRSRKRAREDLNLPSADLPPQKKSRSQKPATLPVRKSPRFSGDRDQPHLILSVPLPHPESPPDELPSSDIATLPSGTAVQPVDLTDSPAGCKRKRDDVPETDNAPAKRHNAAKEAIQTRSMHVARSAVKEVKLIKDAAILVSEPTSRGDEDEDKHIPEKLSDDDEDDILVDPSSTLSSQSPVTVGDTSLLTPLEGKDREEMDNFFHYMMEVESKEQEGSADIDLPNDEPIVDPTPTLDSEASIETIDLENQLSSQLSSADNVAALSVQTNPSVRYSAGDGWYVRFREQPSSPLAPNYIRRSRELSLQQKWAANVSKPPPFDRISLLKSRAVHVQLETRQWFPPGFPQMRIPMVNLAAKPRKRKTTPPLPPPIPAPPPDPSQQPTLSLAPADELYQLQPHYTSSSSSIQLDADLEVPASWPQSNQPLVADTNVGGWISDCTMEPYPVLPTSLDNTYWYTPPPAQQNEGFAQDALEDPSMDQYMDSPQYTQASASFTECQISSTDYQLSDPTGSLDMNSVLESPGWSLEPSQLLILDCPSQAASLSPLSISQDSTLSAMYNYIRGPSECIIPLLFFLDGDIIERGASIKGRHWLPEALPPGAAIHQHSPVLSR